MAMHRRDSCSFNLSTHSIGAPTVVKVKPDHPVDPRRSSAHACYSVARLLSHLLYSVAFNVVITSVVPSLEALLPDQHLERVPERVEEARDLLPV